MREDLGYAFYAITWVPFTQEVLGYASSACLHFTHYRNVREVLGYAFSAWLRFTHCRNVREDLSYAFYATTLVTFT